MEQDIAKRVAELISVNRIGDGKEEGSCDKEYIICGDCLMGGLIKLFSDEVVDFNKQEFIDSCLGLK